MHEKIWDVNSPLRPVLPGQVSCGSTLSLELRVLTMRHVASESRSLVPSLLIAGFAGLVGFGLTFADLGPGESLVLRGLFASGVVIVSGFLIPFFVPRLWQVMVVFAAWGFVAGGGMWLALGEKKIGVILLVLPLALGLCAGYGGARAARYFRRAST